MNKYKVLLSLFLIAIILGLSSCKKFLEETSPDITIPTTVTHFEELLYGEGYPKAQTPIAEVLADNAMFNYAAADIRRLDELNFSSLYFWDKDQELRQSNVLTPLWTNLYKSISVCNLVIEGLENIPQSTERDHVLGQAHVLRAHHYFLLVNYYGEPYRKGELKTFGVPIKTTSVAEDKKYKRNSVNDVYSLIDADLEKGLKIMVKKSSLNGEMNYLSALTLASRVGLFMEEYDKVISLGTHYLNSNLPLLSPEDNIAIGKFISVQNKEITMLFGGSYNELTGVFLNTQLAGRSSFIVADGLYDVFKKDLKPGEKDMRMTWYFERSSNGLLYPKKADSKMRHAYRAAEIYLNLAEAYFKNGNHEAALELINTLRRARIQNYKPFALADFSATELESLIEDERRREFCFEDFRWFDLRRYNREVIHEYEKSDGKMRVKLSPNDWGFTLQVPLIEQSRNPEIELIPHSERIHEKVQ